MDLNKVNNRILWVDWAKTIAIFAIIIIHVSSYYLVESKIFSDYWFISLFFESISRFGILVFVMISGFLLLRKEYTLENFLSKRFKRVLLPFIFWNFIYISFKLIFLNPLGNDFNITNVFLFVLNGFLDPTIVTIQFWFIYMIFALYLATPILSRWIKNASNKEINYFLIIWIFTLFIKYFNINFLLVEYLSLFTGFIGFFILGYYLTINNSPLTKNPKFGLALFLIGFLFIFFGTFITSYFAGSLSLEFIKLGDLTPFSALEAIGIFIMIKSLSPKIENKKFNEYAIKISLASFGIYLVNVLVINAMKLFKVYSTSIHAALIPFFAVLTIAISYVIVNIMYIIPFLRNFSGIKY